jgi:hypothetical protein
MVNDEMYRQMLTVVCKGTYVHRTAFLVTHMVFYNRRGAARESFG